MRWSAASIQVALQLYVQSNKKCIDRINNQNIIRLPSSRTIKLYECKHRFEQGISVGLLNDTINDLFAYRKSRNSIGDPYLILKHDEMYIVGNLIYHPVTHKICGIAAEFDNDAFLQPTYDVITDIEKNLDADAGICQTYSSKMILQTTLRDGTSGWTRPFAFWGEKGSGDSNMLREYIIDELIQELYFHHSLRIEEQITDQSSFNGSFVTSLVGKDIHELSLHRGAILAPMPLYEEKDPALLCKFDPVHVMKGVRNALENSSFENYNHELKCYPLQNGANKITIDDIRKINDKKIGNKFDRCYTLSQQALKTDRFSRQSVSLVLEIFNAHTESALMEDCKRQGKPESETCKFIRHTRLLFEPFVNPSKGSKFTCIASTDHPIFEQLKKSMKYFEDLQKNNPNSCLHDKTFLGMKSFVYGFFETWKRYLSRYEDPNRPGHLRHGVYINGSTHTTDECELLNGYVRHVNGDRSDTYATALASKKVTQQLARNQTKLTSNKHNLTIHRSQQRKQAQTTANK